MIVKRIKDPQQVGGNNGWIQIFTQKGNKERQSLHFGHKPTFIIYLMYLIDKYNRKDDALSLNLLKNKTIFNNLYHSVYSYSSKNADDEFEKLIRRNVDGTFRQGRLPECMTDLRKSLANALKKYDENYLPYTLSSRTHLAIPANKIIFEGDAVELTKLTFV
jgi:hypothetical protein